ncbi:glutathione-dependent formaldehyde-activating GFA [Mesorhizobium opportunistum WSM2075]|uniref:Glutathione-dependent formaldehyde-activating GFA n=2 Tax=Mesorhizobium opportunistum TaxID=593909 RepID=F7YCX3_MESOW|nr:glutathione-dependent formaldehyde-activating GFA [Mesorhizobium opportunistum WSM2075]
MPEEVPFVAGALAVDDEAMTVHAGGCHCGNIRLRFSTDLDPSQIEVRACQCAFCIKHGSRAVADPLGQLIVSVEDHARLHRYRFGLRTADYLICRDCGVYVAAVTTDGGDARAIVIVNALDDRLRFSREPAAMDYDAESRQERIARRQARWMPVEILSAFSG